MHYIMEFLEVCWIVIPALLTKTPVGAICLIFGIMYFIVWFAKRIS